jgi:MFS family permease
MRPTAICHSIDKNRRFVVYCKNIIRLHGFYREKVGLSMSKWLSFYRRYDSVIWLRVLGTVLSTLGNFMIRPFLALFLYDRLDENLLLATLIVGLQPLTGLAAGIFAGDLADRYGRKPVMVAGLSLEAFSILGYAFADSLFAFTALTILGGIGGALFYPAANAQLTDVVPEDRRHEVFALMHTALNVGAACGPLLGVSIYRLNPRIAFLICAVTFLLYILLILFKIPETLPKQQRSFSGSPSKRATTPFRLRDHRLLIGMTLAMIPFTLLYSQVDSILPQHLKTNFDDYLNTFATLMTLNGILVVCTQLLIARYADRFPVRRVVLTAYLFLAGTAFGYGWATTFAWLVFAELLFTLGEMLNGPQINKVVSIMAPPDQRGRYFAIFSSAWPLTGTFGPALGAYAFTQIGGAYWFSIISALLIVAGFAQHRLIALALGRQNPESQPLPQVSS